jgi:multidrug efflux pump subunit AcrA (membrane-fusion protein)
MKLMRNIWLALGNVFLLAACSQQSGEETRPTRKDITEYVFASGSLKAENEYTLTALTDGYLTALSINENDVVRPGTTIGAIDNEQNAINTAYADKLLELARSNRKAESPSLQQAKVRLEAAKQQLTYESGNLARYGALLKANTIPLATYESTELQFNNAKANYEEAVQQYQLLSRQAEENVVVNESKKQVYQSLQAANTLKVVKGGTVLKKWKNAGDFVRKGDAIALIGEADKMYARVEVDENSIAKVKAGQNALIRLNTLADKAYKGVVSDILPTYDEDKQAFTVKIRFTEKPSMCIVNTQLQANIETGVTKNALLIPRKYLNYANQVYVKNEKEPVKLQVSFVSTDWVQVVSGIDEKTVLTLNTIPAK